MPPLFTASLVACLAFIADAALAPAQQLVVAVKNPDPEHLPSLGLWQRDGHCLVAAEFPEIPGNLFDAWCFEGPWVEFLGGVERPSGRLELRHRFNLEPPFRIVTVVTPEQGGVEFLARVEPEPAANGRWPDDVKPPNICWQVKRAPRFASKPDPYAKFMERCFLFLENGQTFLHHTKRNIDARQPPDDPRNNPPWIQRYLAVGEPERQMVAINTTDRFVTPIIGIVSRDEKFLAALANGTSPLATQMWIDCLHNNPLWLPVDGPVAQKTWRYKYYVMENRPEKLLERTNGDFPGAVPRALLTSKQPVR